MTPTESVESIPVFNEEDFNRYFSFLSDNETEVYCYSLMDRKSTAPIKGYGVMHGTAAEIKHQVTVQYEHSPYFQGVVPTLHLVLNSTNLKGRKRSDIQGVRVFCLDIDTPVDRKYIKHQKDLLKPHLIVESSEGKYHFYWRCSPTIDLGTWAIVQAGIARKYFGDEALNQITHMIRVPGIKRTCKDGSEFLPKIVWDSGEYFELKLNDVLDTFGADTFTVGELVLRQKKLHTKETSNKVSEFLTSGQIDYAKIADHIHLGGKRNEGIFEAVNSFVFKGGLNGNGPKTTFDEALVFALTLNSMLLEPLGEDEVEKTASSAWERAGRSLEERAAKGKDKRKEVIGNDSVLPSDEFQYDYNADKFLLENRFTDRAILARVLQRFHKELVRTGEFIYAFDDERGVWERQKDKECRILDSFSQTCARDTVREKEFTEFFCLSKDGFPSATKRMTSERMFLSNGAINGTVGALFRSRKIKLKEIKEFDSDPWKLFCGNGVLDLLTGVLRGVEASDYLLAQTPVHWDESAECPNWEQFVRDVFRDNEEPEEMYRFLQEVFGYTLTGSIDEEKIFVYVGEGANGKSKTMGALYKLLGGSYGARLSCQKLGKTKGALSQEFDRIGAKIEGKRVVIIDDLDTKTQWNEGFVKSLTCDTIVSRKLYAEERDIPNRSKFHIGCNNIPEPESTTSGVVGITRRICLIPFARQFDTQPSVGREIEANINAEISGILKWAVEGARRIAANGGQINYPEEVLMEAKEYKQVHFKDDTILTEILAKNYEKLNIVIDYKACPPLSQLVEEINLKLQDEGVEEANWVNAKKLGRRLSSLGYVHKRAENKKDVKTRYYYIKRKE